MCGYRKICVTYVDPWFPYEEEWLVYHVSWDCTRNPQRPEAISMNAFDKVHECGEGGAGHNGALEPAASQRPLRCYGFQV